LSSNPNEDRGSQLDAVPGYYGVVRLSVEQSNLEECLSQTEKGGVTNVEYSLTDAQAVIGRKK
jgi:hypothetical protein